MSDAVIFNNPVDVIAPYGAYSQSALVPAGARILFTAGVVGETPDGDVPETIEEQYEVMLTNIRKILEAQGMTPSNIVKLTTYLLEPIAGDKMRDIRHSVFGDIKPAATMIFVPRFAGPYKVEIEAFAAAF